MGVEKVGIVDENEGFDNGACDASAEDDEDDAGATTTVIDDSSVGDSCTFDGAWDSDSLALVGAGYLLHSSSISAKISSDVKCVDEDDEDEGAAFATAVDSLSPQYISSSSMRAETLLNSVLLICCLILLTNPAKDAIAAFMDSSDVVQIAKSIKSCRDADSVAISAAKPCSARSNMFGLLLTSIANCEKQ